MSLNNPILVVDNDSVSRGSVYCSLRDRGYSVNIADGGLQALELFKQTDFTILIADMKISDMPGKHLICEVKKMSPQTPIIVISGYGSVQEAVDTMRAGASDYLVKPTSVESIEQSIIKVLNGFSPDPVEFTHKIGRDISNEKRMITSDKKMISILRLAKEVAPSHATVLIMGDTGTGKEMLASYIHSHSRRKKSRLIAVNCAALPETLAESELFGHEKGAFTGAVNRKIGKFEMAHEGTLLLDEVGELPLPMQAKLLRVLQERVVDRVGGKIPVPVDIRIIAVSNVDLEKSVVQGLFREDLFYRLHVIPITLPPLRDRNGDIPLLIEYFLKKFSRVYNKNLPPLSDSTFRSLKKRPWRGNVRELENLIERFVLTGKEDFLKREGRLSGCFGNQNTRGLNLSESMSIKHMEKRLIEKALDQRNGNRTHAAQELGISVRTLRNKLKQYRLETI